MSDATTNSFHERFDAVLAHLRRWSRAYGLAGSFLAGLIFYGLILGFRGFGPETLELVEAAKGLLKHPNRAPGPSSLRNPHPFMEALTAGVIGIARDPTTRPLPYLSLFATAGALPAVWGLASRLGNWRHGAAAVVVFATLPQVAGVGTSAGTGAVFLFLWVWFLRLSVLDHFRWYATIVFWTLGGALLLTWPPLLAWGLLWMCVELRESAVDSGGTPSLGGEFKAAKLPLAIALAPIAVFVIGSLLHPALFAAPKAGWRQFFQHALQWTGPIYSYGGTLYTHARPPLWTGHLVLAWTIPAGVLIAAVIGWLHSVRSAERPTRGGRLVQQMILWGLPLAGLLPWLHRGIRWGEFSFVLVAAPFVAIAAGTAIARAFQSLEALVGDRVGSVASKGLIVATSAAVALLLAAIPYNIHPVEGSYYSEIAGGFERALQKGLPVSRDRVYPIEVLQRAEEKVDDGSLAVIDDSGFVEAYRRLGYIRDVRPAKSTFSADARIRRIGDFKPGRRAVQKNPHAIVDLTDGASPLFTVEGLPIFWLEH